MNPADIITTFETEAEISAATEIFLDPPEYDSKPALEKALHETAFIIKRAWALNEMKTENNPETLQTLGLMVRNMPAIGI